MLQGNVAHHIYITGKKSDLKDTYKLEKFCLYYAQKYNIELQEWHSRTLWLMSKEYFSMDQIHDDNFIARVTIKCINNNLQISKIALLKGQNRDYPVLYPLRRITKWCRVDDKGIKEGSSHPFHQPTELLKPSLLKPNTTPMRQRS
ncbi:MAG: hypothetical protein IPQ18_04655 [Saprospiraceae bacterium]|nr:hypothetical protein [Saprospiraceae bacterium]